jgi:hypothetical protein
MIRAARGRNPLKRVYRAIDRAVAALLERVGDTQVLLISPHGMARYRGAAFSDEIWCGSA